VKLEDNSAESDDEILNNRRIQKIQSIFILSKLEEEELLFDEYNTTHKLDSSNKENY
jgi:hypothetical protein